MRIHPSRRAVLALALALAALAGPAAAQRATAPAPATLSPQDKADVARVEDYLNGIRTLSARFLQIANSGDASEGSVRIERPGRMRLEYDEPVPLLVVAFAGQIVQYDRELRQATYLPLSATPAAILLREKVALSGDVTVTAIERGAGTLRVSIVQTDDPRAGKLTLIFSEAPFRLASWVVVDAQGLMTRVSLDDVRTGIALDPQLFTFRDPNFPGNRN